MPGTIGLNNADSSFFLLSSPDGANTIQMPGGRTSAGMAAAILTEHVKSLTIVETMGKMDTAELELLDPQHVYSRLFRMGVRLDVTWGYKKWNERLLATMPTSIGTFDTFSQSVQRTGLRLFVSTQAGEGTESGEITYTCHLVALDWRGANKQRLFSQGTRGGVVRAVLAELGVTNVIVDFATANQTIDDSTAVVQWETNFAFLARLGYEWRAYFRMAYQAQPAGNNPVLCAIFVDPGKVGQAAFIQAANGGGPLAYKLDYMGGANNVRSWKWVSHEGENGVGDGGNIVWVNGQPTVVRYVVKDEQVTAWRLNNARVHDYLVAQGKEGGPGAVAQATADLFSQQDFYSSTKKGSPPPRYFFDQVVGNTAPEGYGLTVNVEMIGTPMLVPSMPMQFGAGFPSRIKRNQPYNPYGVGSDVTFFLRSHTHTISPAGYLSSLEIVDAFTAYTENQARQ